MSAYEAAFRKIKEATGVGDVNEVIQKFITQKDTEDNLMIMTREAQTRIDQVLGGSRRRTAMEFPGTRIHGLPPDTCAWIAVLSSRRTKRRRSSRSTK